MQVLCQKTTKGAGISQTAIMVNCLENVYIIKLTSISFYKKLGLRFAYINLNVKESDRTPISSWFM